MIPTQLLPPWALTRAFIAGGFAACPSLAADVDVWVSVDPNDTHTGRDYDNAWDATLDARDAIVAYLRDAIAAGASFTLTPQDTPGSPRTLPTTDRSPDRNRVLSFTEGYVLPIPIYRVGTVEFPDATLPYHIICVGADVDDVLSSFDITTHQVALHPAKGVIRGEHWTPVTERGHVIHRKYTTPQRLQKLAARYGWDTLNAKAV